MTDIFKDPRLIFREWQQLCLRTRFLTMPLRNSSQYTTLALTAKKSQFTKMLGILGNIMAFDRF